MSYGDYVLTREIAELSGTTKANFYYINSIVRKNIGGISMILKSSIPEKYKKHISKCLDLEKYRTITALENEISTTEGNLYYHIVTSKNMKMPYIKKGRNKFFKLPDEYVKLKKDGLVPFQIKNKEDEKLSEHIVDMYGMKIGFY